MLKTNCIELTVSSMDKLLTSIIVMPNSFTKDAPSLYTLFLLHANFNKVNLLRSCNSFQSQKVNCTPRSLQLFLILASECDSNQLHEVLPRRVRDGKRQQEVEVVPHSER